MTTENESGGVRNRFALEESDRFLPSGDDAKSPQEPSMLPVVASGAIVLGMAVGGALIGRRFGHPVIGAVGALAVSLPVANWVGETLTDALSDEVNPTVAPPREREGDGPGRRKMPSNGKRVEGKGAKLAPQLALGDELIASNVVFFRGNKAT